MTEAPVVEDTKPADGEAPAEGAEAESEVAVIDYEDVIEKAMKRNWDAPKHLAFSRWMDRESKGKYPMDMATIVACQALYQVFRKTDEFQVVAAEVEAAGPKTREPDLETMTPEQIEAELKKSEERQSKLEAQAKKVAERAARAKELRAKMLAAQNGEAAAEESAPEPEPEVEEPAF